MLKKNTRITTAFDKYIIQSQIGQGGNGTVFDAKDTSGDTVAIKAIDRNNTTRDKLKRFKNEIGFCQNNGHPNIIKVLDYGTYSDDNKDIIFYVMPYFNKTLRTMINEGIDKNEIFKIFMQILDGIGFAHSKGVWHRDIKPENILIDSSNSKIVIADFGIAHFSQDLIVTSIETKATDKLANFIYAAPEQRVRKGIVDGRCDIFSLGLILNEMFTGTVIAGTNFKTAADIDRNYSFVDTLIEMMTAQSPNNRPYPIQDIVIQLKTLIKENNIGTELNQLVNKTIENEEEFNYECPKLIDISYKEGTLKLYLNKITPPEWNNILSEGSYSHQSLMNYGPQVFKQTIKQNNTVFYIRVPLNATHYVDRIVQDFKEWIQSATNVYVTYVTRNKRNERLRKEQEIQRLIKEKEAEKSLASRLKSLL